VNEILAEEYVENVKRLALGLEPIDAGRGSRVGYPIEVVFNETARGLPRPPVDRHDSCLHALLYEPGLADRVALRFIEYSRRYVPRRISYPILTQADAESLTYQNRVRRPVLYPGAAYSAPSLHSGARGRVERNGVPDRWARIEARMPDTDVLVGRAHTDDRGEFLLLIDSTGSPVGDLVNPLEVRIDIFASAASPTPGPDDAPDVDAFWDLPEEEAQTLDPNDPETDPVSAGETLPAGFAKRTDRTISIPLGRMHSEETAFTIP
jgi:hypothetical protein